MSKQFQITIRAFNDKGQKFDLPIIEDIGLKLDMSAIEAGEIGTLFGVSSQQIAIPGTDLVNQYFNHLFDLGTTPAVAFYKSVPAQLLIDSDSVFTGRMYVENITSGDNNDVTYNCVLINETIDFKNQIENKTLSDFSGSWAKYNHTLNWTNISQSWNNNLFSGSIFYPLVNYGSVVNDPTSPNIQFSPPGALIPLTNSMDNPVKGLKTTQFKPAIQVKTIVDTIFDNVNYKYTSSFLNSDYFKSLYYLSTADDNEGLKFVNTVSQSAQVNVSVAQTYPGTLGYFKLQYNNEITDPGNNYNPAISTYTCPVDGTYIVESSLQFFITNYLSTANTWRRFIFQIRINGNPVHLSQINFPNSISGKVGLPTGGVSFTCKAGDTIEMFARYYAASGPTSPEIFNIIPSLADSWMRITSPISVPGSSVDISKIFSSDITVIGFIKGLQEKFNLIIEPLRNERNLLIIEPFDTWSDNGIVVDWTQIVDNNVKYKVTAPVQQAPNKVKFTDFLDQDTLNQTIFKNTNQIFGEYTYSSNSDLTTGEQTIGNYFGATPTKFILNSNTVEVPWLCKEETSKALTPFKFKHRILHKTPVADVPGNEARSGTYYIYDETLAFNKNIAVTYWSTALPVYVTPTTIIPGNIRSYSLPQSSLHCNGQYWFRLISSAPRIDFVNGTYFNYWANWINQIYDVDSRILTLNIILKPTEIQNIQLNDKIWIDGHYYRINKISGASLTETSSVEVELIKTPLRKLNYTGRRRIVRVR